MTNDNNNSKSSSGRSGSDDDKDLDTLIREAELKVIAADREWQRHGDALAVALRSHAGEAKKVGIWGGVGLAVVGVGVGLLRWRSAAKTRAEAKTIVGRVKGLAAGTKGLAQGIAKGVADKWNGRSTTPPPLPAESRRPANFWEAAVTTAGLLLGAATRAGSKSSSGRSGLTPMLFSAGLPLLRRWWRSQTQKKAR